MNFWKEHLPLRAFLILLFFVAGMALIIGGWTMTGQMTGLILMIVGLILLLTALMLYNKPFEDPKQK